MISAGDTCGTVRAGQSDRGRTQALSLYFQGYRLECVKPVSFPDMPTFDVKARNDDLNPSRKLIQ